MVKSTKKHRIWFPLLRVLLFAGFLVMLFMQLVNSDLSFASFQMSSVVYLILVFLLMPLNWWIEYRKWMALLRFNSVNSTDLIERSSFFAGIVTGMLTPNMLGNFIGRMMYFRKRERITITMMTLYASFSQFMVSMIFGSLAIVILLKTPLGELELAQMWPPVLLIVILLLVYFNIDKVVRFLFPRRHRFIFREHRKRQILRFSFYLLLLSILRLLVFTVQFFIALEAFGAEVDGDLIWWIWQYYGWLTCVPSLFLGKLVVRDSIALWVLGFAGLSAAAIIQASIFIWIVNLLLPTLVALFILKKSPAL
jgi:hypothetical protein